MKIKNVLLTLSIAAFAIGFSDLHENLFFWAGRPIGALLFGMYMIALVMEDAADLYNKQEAENLARINGNKKTFRTNNKETCAPALAAAPSR